MKLFENKERTDTKPSRYIDNKYDFYDRNNQPHISRVRDILNDWFSKYPIDEQNELKSRFKKDFESALYELYLFTFFFQLGFDIVIHPTLPNTSKHPDFLLQKSEIEVYIEAKITSKLSRQDKSKEQMINTLFDSIDKMYSPNFYIGIDDVVLKMDKQPSAKSIIKFIENRMEESNVEELRKYMIEEYDFKDLKYEDKDIQVSFHLIPKHPSERGKRDLRVITTDSSKKWKDNNNGIINSLIKKSMRYGDINKPYIICINTFTGTFFNEENLIDAIWGSTCQYEDENKIFRLDNGFFGSIKNKKYTRVSGVMITNVMDANLQSANYLFCKNPYSIYDFDFSIMGLDYYSLIENNVVKIISSNYEK